MVTPEIKMSCKLCQGVKSFLTTVYRLTQHGVNRVVEQIDVHVVKNKHITSDSAQKTNHEESNIYEDHVVYKKLPSVRELLY